MLTQSNIDIYFNSMFHVYVENGIEDMSTDLQKVKVADNEV